MKIKTKKIVVLFSLFSLFASTFYFAFFSIKNDASNGTVYCPLTKKLQPVHPPKKSAGDISINDFCANDKEKSEFIKVLLNSENLFLINETQFENLAFNYFQTGKTAFQSLPNLPDLPEQNLAKSFYSAAVTGIYDRQISFFKIKTEQFDFAQTPRPPTIQASAKFDFQIVRLLEKISQNINPRSPPANLS